MFDYKRVEMVVEYVKSLGIIPEIIEVPYTKGRYAGCQYHPENPRKTTIILNERSVAEDLVHELCHSILALEGYPRTETPKGNQLANILASALNSIVEHGRIIQMGDQLGFNLRIDERQMSKMESRLESGDLNQPWDIEAIFYADLDIRCSDPEFWERINKELYMKKYPHIRDKGIKFLKTVKQYGYCKTADQARGCYRKLAFMVGLKEHETYKMYPKPS